MIGKMRFNGSPEGLVYTLKSDLFKYFLEYFRRKPSRKTSTFDDLQAIAINFDITVFCKNDWRADNPEIQGKCLISFREGDVVSKQEQVTKCKYSSKKIRPRGEEKVSVWRGFSKVTFCKAHFLLWNCLPQ